MVVEGEKGVGLVVVCVLGGGNLLVRKYEIKEPNLIPVQTQAEELAIGAFEGISNVTDTDRTDVVAEQIQRLKYEMK